MFWDFLQFCKEVVWQWANLIAGVVIAAVWLCYEKFTGKTVPMKVFIWLFGLCVLGAFFGAWREQYIKAKQGPKLQGIISGASSGEGDNGATWVLPLLSITNSGPPTIVDIEAATIKCGEKSFTGLQGIIYEEGTRHIFQTGVETLNRSDMIIEKLVAPIPSGGRTSGWLMYELKDISATELRRRGYEIIIPFKDASGNEYKASTPPADQMGGEPVYVPGVNNPFLRHAGEPPVPRSSMAPPDITPPSPTPDKGASPP